LPFIVAFLMDINEINEHIDALRFIAEDEREGIAQDILVNVLTALQKTKNDLNSQIKAISELEKKISGFLEPNSVENFQEEEIFPVGFATIVNLTNNFVSVTATYTMEGTTPVRENLTVEAGETGTFGWKTCVIEGKEYSYEITSLEAELGNKKIVLNTLRGKQDGTAVFMISNEVQFVQKY